MAEPDRESTTGMPRWVKVFGITAIVLVLLVVIIMLISGGEHGPDRHLPGGETRGDPTRPITPAIEHRAQAS